MSDTEAQFSRELTTALDKGTALGELLAMAAPVARKGPQRADDIRVVKRAVAG